MGSLTNEEKQKIINEAIKNRDVLTLLIPASNKGSYVTWNDVLSYLNNPDNSKIRLWSRRRMTLENYKNDPLYKQAMKQPRYVRIHYSDGKTPYKLIYIGPSDQSELINHLKNSNLTYLLDEGFYGENGPKGFKISFDENLPRTYTNIITDPALKEYYGGYANAAYNVNQLRNSYSDKDLNNMIYPVTMREKQHTYFTDSKGYRYDNNYEVPVNYMIVPMDDDDGIYYNVYKLPNMFLNDKDYDDYLHNEERNKQAILSNPDYAEDPDKPSSYIDELKYIWDNEDASTFKKAADTFFTTIGQLSFGEQGEKLGYFLDQHDPSSNLKRNYNIHPSLWPDWKNMSEYELWRHLTNYSQYQSNVRNYGMNDVYNPPFWRDVMSQTGLGLDIASLITGNGLSAVNGMREGVNLLGALNKVNPMRLTPASIVRGTRTAIKSVPRVAKNSVNVVRNSKTLAKNAATNVKNFVKNFDKGAATNFAANSALKTTASAMNTVGDLYLGGLVVNGVNEGVKSLTGLYPTDYVKKNVLHLPEKYESKYLNKFLDNSARMLYDTSELLVDLAPWWLAGKVTGGVQNFAYNPRFNRNWTAYKSMPKLIARDIMDNKWENLGLIGIHGANVALNYDSEDNETK